jgi:hypothetical protein
MRVAALLRWSFPPTRQAFWDGQFWQEFIRVQSDKLLLVVLAFFLWKVGLHDDMKYVIGGLIVAINHNRFRWNP